MQKIYYLIVVLLFFNFSCEGLLESVPLSGSTLYYNSFEKDSDLNGWHGISVSNLYNDAPLYGGKKSIYISGGCMRPHASYAFKSTDRDIHVTLEFYGKNLSNGGTVELMVGTDYFNIHSVMVNDTEWMQYTSEEDLFWPADSTLTICLNSGGDNPSSMLIDCLRLVEVE